MAEEQIEQKSVIYTDSLKPSIGKFDGEEGYSWNQVSDAWIDGYHECQKEHEWHYVKDGNPDNENDILCQISKDEVEVGYYHTKQKRYYTIDGQPIDVIRWQEIVLPKESE